MGWRAGVKAAKGKRFVLTTDVGKKRFGWTSRRKRFELGKQISRPLKRSALIGKKRFSVKQPCLLGRSTGRRSASFPRGRTTKRFGMLGRAVWGKRFDWKKGRSASL